MPKSVMWGGGTSLSVTTLTGSTEYPVDGGERETRSPDEPNTKFRFPQEKKQSHPLVSVHEKIEGKRSCVRDVEATCHGQMLVALQSGYRSWVFFFFQGWLSHFAPFSLVQRAKSTWRTRGTGIPCEEVTQSSFSISGSREDCV
jgi:hypothetical protein